jgi:hypothetical protein
MMLLVPFSSKGRKKDFNVRQREEKKDKEKTKTKTKGRGKTTP